MNNIKRLNTTILIHVILVLLFTTLSLFSNSAIFLITGVVFSLLISFTSQLLPQDRRSSFFKIVTIIFLFYSVFILFSVWVFVQNPLTDFYVDRDETKFIMHANVLSKLSYVRIWKLSFSKFIYSESPFYIALIGSLQKLANTDLVYCLIFQKFVSAILGSFVAGIVYLTSKRFVNNDSKAFKAALIYGLFSFLLFYSVGMLRDVHMALIYAIGLYIITGNNYNLKNYIVLIGLGFIAYYIRIENGLFFISFIGAWAFKRGGKYKFVIAFGTIIIVIAGLFVAGGINRIANTAASTSEVYEAREHAIYDNSGSIGVKLNQLPVPFNYIAKSIWGQATPFPFWYYLSRGKTWLQQIFYLPQAIPGLLWFLVWFRIISEYKISIRFFKEHKSLVALSLLYILLVSLTQPNPRRLFYIYPFIFMWYLYIDGKVIRSKDLRIAIPIYLFLLLLYLGIKL